MPKLKRLTSVWLFLSSYFPLFIVLVIRDFNFDNFRLSTFYLSIPILYLVLWVCGNTLDFINYVEKREPTLKIAIAKYSLKTNDLVVYSIPYVLSFLTTSLSNPNDLASLIFFLILFYEMSYRAQVLLFNPVLALIGYKLYEIEYQYKDRPRGPVYLLSKNDVLPNQDMSIFAISRNIYIEVLESEPYERGQ